MSYVVSIGRRISLFLVKEYIVDIWEVRKQILYGNDTCPQSQSSVGDLGGVTGVDGQRSGTNKVSPTIYILVLIHACACVCSCTCGSTHGSVCGQWREDYDSYLSIIMHARNSLAFLWVHA